MKINLPVTNIERDYHANEKLVSETDLKGIVTSANASFCEVAGYAEREMIGNNHNMVRHPDMPVEAFEDLWRTVKTGAQWVGLVKNRCANGDYYWVRAVVTPIRTGDSITGYRSVRNKPSRAEISAADALYKRLKSGEKIPLDTLASRRKAAGWLGGFSLSARYWMLFALYGASSVAVLALAMSGWSGGAMLAVFGAGLLASVLVTGYFVAHAKKSVGLVVSGMMRWEAGDLLARADYCGGDEFGAIAAAFNSASDMANVALAEVAQVTSAMARGDVNRRIRATLPRDLAVMKQEFNGAIDNVALVLEAFEGLCNALVQGNFAWRSNNSKVEGVLGENLRRAELAMCSIEAVMLDIARVLVALSSGDLREEVSVPTQGQLTTLKGRINTNFEQLSMSFAALASSVQHLAAAAHESSTAIGQISDGAQNQMHAINQVATAVRQTASSVADVTQNTEAASRKSQESLAIVRDGKVKMDRMIEVVNSIAANSEKINKITEVIEGIANKTNLLSLNAAIEAARAGEHGKGFAVVAEEVGKLAANSASSTQEIAQLVQQAVADANRAVATVREVAADMQRIENGSVETEGMMQRISAALEEQSSALNNIDSNATNLKQVAQSNAAASEEITATMIDLSRIAKDASVTVGRYKLKNNSGEFAGMRQAHMNWLVTVQDIMAGRKNVAEVKVVSHRDCKLGQWLYSEGMNKYGNLPVMNTLEHDHMCMHDNVRKVVESMQSGDRTQAAVASREVELLSGKVVEYLFDVEKRVG
ncbi:MAG: hypothetical protein A2Z87_06310 [Gallionellales bacterium GWA2_54_124]|nr:MAG: hypothetical protein A2Z87_06310 [Gallionellales bacterium GWA2_54_124]